MALAIIGGTGVYQLGVDATEERINTPYGEVLLYRQKIGVRDVVFLPRHGVTHTVPPHRVNYRANIWALYHIGVTEVLSTQAVGSMNVALAPGHYVLLSQFIDWTKGRASTFFDGTDGVVAHVDVSQPYCPRFTGLVMRAGEFLEQQLHPAGVYACTEGPRFETAAEVKMLRQFGADVVGMTNVPEVVLAREAGICYAALCIVCNWGAGMTEMSLAQEDVVAIIKEQQENLQRVVRQLANLPPQGVCTCGTLGFAHLLSR